MAKPFYFVVQSWMLEEMNLSLSEAAVYAYLEGLTSSQKLERKGWYGSQRQLASTLHTSPSTMHDILGRLEKQGFVHISNGHIFSTVHRKPAPETPTVQISDTKLPLEGSDLPF